MSRLVMKFGGTSVADLDRIRNVARHVKREVEDGHDVAVVVSAMAGRTDQLVDWCRQAAPLHDAREYDAVVASGEQVTAGLLALVLEGMGVNARSWQGWQLPVLTSDAHGSARILDVNGAELMRRFKERSEVSFSEEEKELYETLFQSFAPFEFMKLLRVGQWREARGAGVRPG